MRQVLGWVKRLCAAVTITLPMLAKAGEIAITLDDLPYLAPSRTTPEEGLGQVTAINRALATYGITATGFVIGQSITPETRPALDAFVAAGHHLGNHSWSHPTYDKITLWQFRNETRRTDRAMRPWTDAPEFYRFPYLREGYRDGARRAALRVLAKLGYRNAPVSIDNDEWKFNVEYVEAVARNDATAAARIADAYIAHMQDRTLHFQSLARGALGRDVNHILLLHMNRINADHLHRLLDWYAAAGWQFITLKEAMTDPLYGMPGRYTGRRGVSQIERVIGQPSD